MADMAPEPLASDPPPTARLRAVSVLLTLIALGMAGWAGWAT
jgi:hypothetical protein